MPSDKEALTVKGLISKILTPHPGIKDIVAGQHAKFTLRAALVLAAAGLIAIPVIFIVGFKLSPDVSPIPLGISLILFVAAMGVSIFFGRTDNPSFGSIILIASLILMGFATGAIYPTVAPELLLLMNIPALIIGSLLLPAFFIIAISGINILALFVFPLQLGSNANTGILFAVGFVAIHIIVIVLSRVREVFEDQQIDELATMQARLEERVGERTKSARIASEIAQDLAASSTMDEVARQATSQIVSRLGFSYAGLYLPDETGQQFELRSAYGTNAEALLADRKQVPTGPTTPIGWVALNKQPRIISRVDDDAAPLQTNFLQGSRAEMTIPILSKELLLGILDVQATDAGSFENEAIVALQMVASQIATAIQNVHRFESGQGMFGEAASIYRDGYQLVRAQTMGDIHRIVQNIFNKGRFTSIFFAVEKGQLRITAQAGARPTEGETLQDATGIVAAEMEPILNSGPFIGEGARMNNLPYSIVKVLRQLQIFSVALVPIKQNDDLVAVIMVGTREKQPLGDLDIQPYITIANLISDSIDRIRETQNAERRIAEMEAITMVGQEISTVRDLPTLYAVLHKRVRDSLGDANFLVAIYDASTNSIAIPYMFEKGYEGGEATKVEPFPLGEGLTSILIRTRQPLMLVQDTEKRAAALGAKTAGKPAKSWLGTPLIISGEVIGAIVAQDTERELAFDESDLRFLTTLSTQVAGAIHNTRLLEETRSRALQLQTAAEIARDISGSLDVGELLSKAVTLIRERFNFYHASVFLLDSSGESAVIKEATGEAGTQMKRAGHKLKVGSKSIVGYVTGSGEILIVNDTSRDATYYANPLLPETRAEVAIPLKVGARTLGALDVQSAEAYAFGKEEIYVLQILADQLAVAVINSELFAETQEHLSQHRLLHHVTTAAASGTTLEEALNSAAQGLQVTLGGDRVAILLADRERKILIVQAIAGYSEEVKQLEVPYGEGITGWVAIHQQPQRINDVIQDARYIQVGSNVRSELAIPLSYRGELLGVLNVESDQVGAYSENDEEMLGTLGGSLAAIISNTRLIEQVRRQVDRERLLYEVTSKIRRSTDMQTIMATTATELSKALGARQATISIDIEGGPKSAPDAPRKENR